MPKMKKRKGNCTHWHVCIHHWDFGRGQDVPLCGESEWLQFQVVPGPSLVTCDLVLCTVAVVANLEVKLGFQLQPYHGLFTIVFIVA